MGSKKNVVNVLPIEDFSWEWIDTYKGKKVVDLRVEKKEGSTPIFNACIVSYTDEKETTIKKYGINPYNYRILVDLEVVEPEAGRELIKWTAAQGDEAEAEAQELKLFSSQVALKLYKRLLKLDGPLVKSVNSSLDFLPLLLPLFRLPGFPEAWDAYLEVPDDGISINSEEEDKQVGLTAGVLGYPELGAASKKTHSDMEFLSVMAIICISKNFINSDQFDNVVTARASGLSHVISSRGLTKEKAKKLVQYESYNELSQVFSFFPRMRSMIYRHILLVSTGAPTVNYVRPLLKDSQMTVYKLISLFVFSADKTRAHILGIINKEMIEFLKSYKSVTQRYGEEHWEYAKLLSSVEQETATTGYPMLVTAALYYMFLRTGSTTYQNLKVKHGKSKAIARAVATPLKVDFVSVVPENLASQMKKIDQKLLEKLGIKWDEIEKVGIDAACGPPDESYIAELNFLADPANYAGKNEKLLRK